MVDICEDCNLGIAYKLTIPKTSIKFIGDLDKVLEDARETLSLSGASCLIQQIKINDRGEEVISS